MIKQYMVIMVMKNTSDMDCPIHTIVYKDTIEEAKQYSETAPYYIDYIGIIDTKVGLYEDHWFKGHGWRGNFMKSLLDAGIL